MLCEQAPPREKRARRVDRDLQPSTEHANLTLRWEAEVPVILFTTSESSSRLQQELQQDAELARIGPVSG